MPNQLTTNAIVWLYFAKDPNDKKAKCLHCSQIINYAKSSYSNLKRHLSRKHPFLLNVPKKLGLAQKKDHFVMQHFIKMANKKVKCVHCGSIMSYNVMSNLRRHMAKKHPTVEIKDKVQSGVVHQVERLYEGTHSPTDSMYNSSKASIVSSNDSDADNDSKHGPIQLQPIDSTGLTEPIRIEVNRLSQMIDEPIMVDHNASHGSNNFLSIGLKDINMKSAAYATNVALELESLDHRQRIIAEKLISDVKTLGLTIWKHFTKEPGKRGRCKHCFKEISYQYTTFSLRRHLKNKHPAIELDEGNGSENSFEQSFDNPYDSSDSFSRSFKASPPGVESDVETENVELLDNNGRPEPTPEMEIINYDLDTKPIVDDQELIQDLTHHADSIIQYDQTSLIHNDSDQGDDMGQVIEETIIGTIVDPSAIVEQCADTRHVNAKRELSRTAVMKSNMEDINKKTAAFATHTALEIESLTRRQRIIAKKLISEVLYHAKLENLTEYSMLVVRVGTFEQVQSSLGTD
uniref:BED-type domain-containing protein n=1 Tax=Anopheles dirus TaxID=7168 RepID=A0A182MZ18_9DIPT